MNGSALEAALSLLAGAALPECGTSRGFFPVGCLDAALLRDHPFRRNPGKTRTGRKIRSFQAIHLREALEDATPVLRGLITTLLADLELL